MTKSVDEKHWRKMGRINLPTDEIADEKNGEKMPTYQPVKKFKGVSYYESETRRHSGRADKCYSVRYQNAAGKTERVTVGWASEGVTAEYANQVRTRLISEGRDAVFGVKATKDAPVVTMETLHLSYMRHADVSEGQLYNAQGFWCNWIGPEWAKRTPESITEADITAMLDRARAARRKPKTVNNILTHVKALFSEGKSRGLVKSKPAEGMTVKVPDNERLAHLTPEYVFMILEALSEDSQDAFDICFHALITGNRLGECRTLKRQCVDFERRLIILPETKSKKTRGAHIPDPLFDILKRRCDGLGPNDYVYTNAGRPWPREGVRLFWDYVNPFFNEGIKDYRFRVVFHTFRHTFASWLAEAGTHAFAMQKLMGHSDPRTTAKYTKFPGRYERDAVDTAVVGHVPGLAGLVEPGAHAAA